MTKGYLKLYILQALHAKSLSGYALMNEIARTTGKKPSPGSMYPILQVMQDEGLVVCSVSGKSRICKITRKGKSGLAKLTKEFERNLSKQISACKIQTELGTMTKDFTINIKNYMAIADVMQEIKLDISVILSKQNFEPKSLRRELDLFRKKLEKLK